ncbi:hypothetical protein HO133_005573 [Letharia lupina]|uniref:Uncharacterized protein n=1 Tax=Letharia lupina TaxID=560253 RepID=A0A8H6C8X0_9LECA|nr:uncharacterized protein HO133_005573 [Letharia lupina]KAF6219029.1 hypothetical protein HO133_005573 [Letharia lupina]
MAAETYSTPIFVSCGYEPKRRTPAELLKRAKANRYKQEGHQEEDSKRDNTKYMKKTLRDRDIALRRYKK